jgi:protein-S-isoprenylcysteine O-methyltransferase Ste14
VTVIHKIIENDRLGTLLGAGFFTFWIGQRVYFNYHHTVLWWLVTFQFSLFVIAYLTRQPAREHAHGFWEIIYPFICAALPFALDNYPFKPVGRSVVLAPVYLGLMLAGTVLIIAGVGWLRRSFSIMTEVREPVIKGVYRFFRHPMYLGSMVASLGLLLYNYLHLNLAIFAIFCAAQIYRARREEQKIAAVHPEYRDYLARTRWLWKI